MRLGAWIVAYIVGWLVSTVGRADLGTGWMVLIIVLLVLVGYRAFDALLDADRGLAEK